METAVKTTMSTAIFNSLVTNLECDSWDLKGSIGFSKQIGKHTINIYGEAKDDFKLIVEEFGVTTKNGWETLEPTKEQLQILSKKISDKADELFNEKREDERWYQDNKNYDVRAEQGLYSYGY